MQVFSCYKKSDGKLATQGDTITENITPITVHKIDDTLFRAFPVDIEYYKKNGIKVEIVDKNSADNSKEQVKEYYTNPVVVNGKNFSILYSMVNEKMVIRDVELMGVSIFNEWNSIFGLTKADNLQSWGGASKDVVGRLFYTNDILSINFEFESNHLSKIRIYYEP